MREGKSVKTGGKWRKMEERQEARGPSAAQSARGLSCVITYGSVKDKVRENSADVWNSCSNPRASDTLFMGTFASVANSLVTSSANGVRDVRVDMEIWEFHGVP